MSSTVRTRINTKRPRIQWDRTKYLEMQKWLQSFLNTDVMVCEGVLKIIIILKKKDENVNEICICIPFTLLCWENFTWFVWIGHFLVTIQEKKVVTGLSFVLADVVYAMVIRLGNLFSHLRVGVGKSASSLSSALCPCISLAKTISLSFGFLISKKKGNYFLL